MIGLLLPTLFFFLQSIYDSSNAYHDYSSTDCDFEKEKCSWYWDKTVRNGFKVLSGEEADLFHRQSSRENKSRFADANGDHDGHFLFVEMTEGDQNVHVWSDRYSNTSRQCKVELYLKMVNMSNGKFSVVIEGSGVAWIIEEIMGNNKNIWEKYSFRISRIRQEFHVLLEVSPSRTSRSQLSIDNIRMVDCFPKGPIFRNCSSDLFQCSRGENDFCLNKTQVCDIQQDCLSEEDEKQNCEKVPRFARCTFEDSWCGWENLHSTVFTWTRVTGTGAKRRYAGPAFDHTFNNESGKFLHVNMSSVKSATFGDPAVMKSTLMNPPPRYHGRPSSAYYQSCFVRFFYHQFGMYTPSLALFITEMNPESERRMMLWFSYGNKGDAWQRQAVLISTNITYSYFLQFEARRGLKSLGIVALDDVSFSPECFGLNVPEEEKEGYDYDHFSGYVVPTQLVEEHRDFFNKTVYYFSNCGVGGPNGPVPENCSVAYNNTNTNVTVLQNATWSGVQRWVVPYHGFYTIVAKGASGGRGFDGLGISKGAVVAAVVELAKSQFLYILVGQEGGSACKKSFSVTPEYSCGETKAMNVSTLYDAPKQIKESHDTYNGGSGGGGGGGTFVFFWSPKNGRSPLVVSGGGGGLSGGSYFDDGSQHGKGVNVNQPGITGSENGNSSAGAGGGWFPSNSTSRAVTGESLVRGAIGGKACGKADDLHGAGGFGGGGGGCFTGGGGGGFAGGSAYRSNKNGQGGFSFVSDAVSVREISPGKNIGHGAVVIIPAIKGCGCEYLCAAFDENRHKVKCICPKGSDLKSDGLSCSYLKKPQTSLTEQLLMTLIGIMTTVLFLFFIYFLYRHSVHTKKKRRRIKMDKQSEIELRRLRVASENVMTELNPIYEFGENTYTAKDLNELPRENLKLLRPLGRGAFGEVYQGLFRCRDNNIPELPVAVKTLPAPLSNQAEVDFITEALIMSQFAHPNIVHFIGVCFDKHPRFIVLELLAGGDLKNFLRESRPKPNQTSQLSMKDLVTCAIDIAKGCAYLEQHRFIHRDVAARNCLLTTKGPGRTVKIADFGMARDIYRADYYRKGGTAVLPVRWMPPEAFQDGIFTTKTDVWSFGIVLWEIMSLGYMPYPGCGNREVMRLVLSGGRMDPPVNCPPPVYSIMKKCWQSKPKNRPNFQLIIERLGYCLQDPEVLETPLPIFDQMPPLEQDTTIMRPEEETSHFYRPGESTEYVKPTAKVVTAGSSDFDDPAGVSRLRHKGRRSFISPLSLDPSALFTNPIQGSPQIFERSSNQQPPRSKHTINDKEESFC